MKKFLFCVAIFLSAIAGFAETQLPKPTTRFTDHAHVVSSEVATQIEAKLTALEKLDSTQFIVYIYPVLDTESSMEDYTQRTVQAWGIGQKGKDNGLALFIFAKDSDGHKRLRFEVGYGLEGAFPDAKAKLVLEREIIPSLKAGDWNTALIKGTEGAIKEIQGEYVAPKKKGSYKWILWVIGAWVVLLIIFPRYTWDITVAVIDGLASSSGSSGRKGGGGFSGGGGSFGGGGASGRA